MDVILQFNEIPSDLIEFFEPIQSDLTDVITFPTASYSGAHFAVFPEALPTICIKASTPEVGVCAICGSPWARMIDRDIIPADEDRISSGKTGMRTTDNLISGSEMRKRQTKHPNLTVGWMPTCDCGDDTRVPATVLDPFAGAGTTLLAALRLGRNAIGYEISKEYCILAKDRINGKQQQKLWQHLTITN